MKNYAIINTGTISNIIVIEDITQYPGYPSSTENFVDLTGISPQPNIGDSYSNGTFSPPTPPTLTPQQYADLAKQAGEDYISGFFSTIELLSIFQLLLQGNNTQKQMALAIQNWINQVIAEGINHASNPNFNQFTPPPYTYLQIVGAT